MFRYFQIFFVLMLAHSSFAVCTKYGIAVVNIQSILENSTAMMDVKNATEEMVRNMQDTFNKKEAELNIEEKNLIEHQNKLTKQEFEKKAEEFDKKVTKIQTHIREEKIKLEQAQAAAINKINEVALEVIKNISHDKCIEIVLPSVNALYVAEHLNITTEVLAKLNETIPSMRIDILQ